MPSTLLAISENVQKKFHIYYSIKFLAYTFNLQILLEHYFR